MKKNNEEIRWEQRLPDRLQIEAGHATSGRCMALHIDAAAVEALRRIAEELHRMSIDPGERKAMRDQRALDQAWAACVERDVNKKA